MAIEKIVCYSQRKGHAMALAATWEAMMQVRRRAGGMVEELGRGEEQRGAVGKNFFVSDFCGKEQDKKLRIG